MTGNRRLLTRILLSAAPPALLAAQNLAIFFRHYFRGYGFPWDFTGSYYAATAYWTEAVSRGALPGWMPFQGMGYPFRLDLQSGLCYPPLWLFPLLRMPYTLRAAVVVQALHVLLGALGMYALLRTALRTRLEAVAGAFAFQLFGGFYSNAEHVDIVRAFAFTPWLLAALVPPRRDEPSMPRRLLALPLAVCAAATGGYPGNLIAFLFLSGVWLASVLASRRLDRGSRRWAAAAAAGVALGLAMSAAQLGPAWVFRGELERHRIADALERASLGIVHLPGLVEDTRGMPGDPSMASTFVGFAVVCGLAFLDRRALRGRAPFVVLLAVSALMAAGDNTPLHPALRRLVAPLAYSRFPSSDYRGVAAAAMIVLAAAGWQALRRRPPSTGRFVLRLALAGAFAAWAVASVARRVPMPAARANAAESFVVVASALLLWRGPRRSLVRVGVLTALLGALALDAARVLPRLEQDWAVADLVETCRVFQPPLARLADQGLVVRPEVFAARVGPRPARTLGEAGYRASGYLTGEYDLADFGGPVLDARAAASADPASLAYAARAWLPVVVAPPASGSAVRVPDLALRLRSAASDARIVQRLYGADRILYGVSLERPALVVENEIYFPGWTARLRRDATGPEEPIDAVRVNGIWRGWPLPGGSYELLARFALPRARELTVTAAVAWLAWAGFVLASLRRRHRRGIRPPS